MSNYGLNVLDRSQCLSLLQTQRVGRVGVCSGRPGVFPVLYALLDGDIVFRTAPGEKLIAAALHRDVVFEIDDYDVQTHVGWSVNVIGEAEEITDPDELERAEALDLQPWAGEVRDRYVRIRTSDVSGRQIRPDVLEHATVTEPLVVVGVDGSEGSLAALRVAVEEARLRSADLRVVLAWQLTWTEMATVIPAVFGETEQHAQSLLDAAVASIDSDLAAGIEISGELVNGHAASALLEAAWDANLLVVGTRGTSGLTGTLVGSVADSVIHHARCPVLVVPSPSP